MQQVVADLRIQKYLALISAERMTPLSSASQLYSVSHAVTPV
jgi:hypothetical protein